MIQIRRRGDQSMGCWFPLKVWATVIISFWVSSLRLNSATPVEVRMSLSRNHGVSAAGENLSRLELLRIGIKHDAKRFGAWAATAAPAASMPERKGKVALSPILPAPDNGGFLMDLHIGTPPVKLRSLMDIGSDVTWTQCLPCSRRRCFAQDTPIFNPQNSTSFQKSGRRRNNTRRIKYGDGSTIEGYYASESLTFEGNVSFPNFTFLCGKNSSVGFEFQHTSGLVGMSRGRLSLVSQLNVSQFSYCLPGLGSNSTGTLRIGGPSSTAGGGERATTTPFAKNPATNDSAKSQFYYVSVEGISVGKTRLESVPKEAFQLNRNGSGGMIVDTGTSLTYLPTAAFNAVVGEVHKQLKLPWYNNSDLPCFTLPQRSNGISFPTLTLHLQGAHASAATNLSLPEENVFIIEEDEGRNTTCLAIVDAGGGGSFGVLGNFVQQNMMMSYDLAQNTLSFEPTNCSRHSSF